MTHPIGTARVVTRPDGTASGEGVWRLTLSEAPRDQEKPPHA